MRAPAILCTLLALSLAGRLAAEDYLACARAYAEAMIEHGRDVYGSVSSPLFISALDRGSLSRGSYPDIPGIRNADRSLKGGNPQKDYALYQLLYQLSEVTGEPRYATEADAALAFFLANCQSPATGLLAWGEHLSWDFGKEQVTGSDDKHEVVVTWGLWDRCYALAPEPSWRFALGEWQHQIADQQTGAFSRHATYSKHAPGADADFPRYAGQMILDWATALAQPANAGRPELPELKRAIAVLVTRMEENARLHPQGPGYLVAARDNGAHQQISWTLSNLTLAHCLWLAIPLIEDPALVERMRALALKQDADFFKRPHTIAEGGGFVATVDARTGEPRARSMNRPYTDTWTFAYGQHCHANFAVELLQRHDDLVASHPDLAQGYRRLILAAADSYLASDPDPEQQIAPDVIARLIDMFIGAHRLTGDGRHLARARHFADLGLTLLLDEGNPLPKASNRHSHYESITGGPDFMKALLDLHLATR